MQSLTFPESKNFHFISVLAGELSHSLTSEDVLSTEAKEVYSAIFELLLNAAEPLKYIENDVERSLSAELMQSPEVFDLEKAKTLFANSALSILNQSLALALISWFEHGTESLARWLNLKSDEQKTFLYIACNLFTSLDSRFSAEQFLKYLALKYVSKLGQQFDEQQLQAYINIVILQSKFCYELRIDFELAFTLLNSGLDVLDNLNTRVKDSLLYLECEQVLTGKLGDLYSRHVYVNLANQLCHRNLAISRRIIKQFGGTPARFQELAIAFGRLGNFEELYHDSVRAAKKWYLQSLIIIEEQMAKFGETPERMEYVIKLLHALVFRYNSGESLVSKRNILAECLAICDKLIYVDGETEERLDILADVLENLHYGEREKDFANAERSLAIRERLFAGDSEARGYLRSLFYPFTKLANNYARSGNEEAARATYTRFINIAENQISLKPNFLDSDMLSAALRYLAEFEYEIGNFVSAKACFTRYLAVLDEYPLPSSEIEIKISVLHRLAMLDEANGDDASAMDHYLQIVAINNQQYIEQSASPECLRALTVALSRLADHDDCNILTALEGYKKSLIILECLMYAFGESTEVIQGLNILIEQWTDEMDLSLLSDVKVCYARYSLIVDRLLADLEQKPKFRSNVMDELRRFFHKEETLNSIDTDTDTDYIFLDFEF
ncbi:hypothetical protein LMJ53_15580 [Rheinheimera sp. UJ51]|uniref:tetratricopeptide repeat protein n=1 Tax=Rheinheimera sp. UJ51 TaxID=2892446 RepID=UPI001E5DF924|nr:hypothetical protein [Rheinheimera sp. UJ51]MCC5453141.1 hypothetical protein [Rheinheimera sp. UJ51]